MNENINELENYLLLFVKNEYEIENRDVSHGITHSLAVLKTSKLIAKTEYINHPNYLDILRGITIVSILHDVADSKYDDENKTLKNKLNNFCKIFENKELIIKTIDCISYSKEEKERRENKIIDYEKELGLIYSIVRHIVSDADKLEAIGFSGIIRCIEYSKHKYPFYNNDEIMKEVNNHAQTKLLRIKDEFIRTKTGKKLAIPLHNEIVLLLDKITNNKFI